MLKKIISFLFGNIFNKFNLWKWFWKSILQSSTIFFHSKKWIDQFNWHYWYHFWKEQRRGRCKFWKINNFSWTIFELQLPSISFNLILENFSAMSNFSKLINSKGFSAMSFPNSFLHHFHFWFHFDLNFWKWWRLS